MKEETSSNATFALYDFCARYCAEKDQSDLDRAIAGGEDAVDRYLFTQRKLYEIGSALGPSCCSSTRDEKRRE